MATRHKLSAAWNNMNAVELAELTEDIRVNGQRTPIVMLGTQVLDGWHRALACNKLKIQVLKRDYDPATDGPLRAFVDSLNGQRRNQTAAQRTAAMILTARWEAEENGTAPPPISAIAEEGGVSKRTVNHINAGIEAGLGEQIVSGELTPRAANEVAQEQKREARGEEPTVKKPSRDQSEIIELRMEIADLRAKNAELIAELQSVVNLSLDDEEQKKKWQQVYGQIDTLESQRDEWMMKSHSWQKEAMALRKKLGRIK